VQVNDDFAVYHQAAGIVGAHVPGFDLSPGFPDPQSTFLYTSSVLAEVTLWNQVQFGLGPSFGVGRQRVPNWVALGHFYTVLGGGGTIRLAFTFGGTGLGTRSGFSIAMQADLIYHGGTVTSVEPIFGGTVLVERISVAGAVAVGGITLGWESF
jgi:hypothetical protein